MKNLWILDSEGDDLLDGLTKFHCIVLNEIHTENWVVFLDKDLLDEASQEICDKHSATIYSLNEFGDWVKENPSALACHNIFGYDLPAFEKLLGIPWDMFPESVNGKSMKIFDTLSMSRALHPDRYVPFGCSTKVFNPVTKKHDTVGPHGLAAWGYRVANAKPVVHDWRDQPLHVYLNRCFEDVVINGKVWDALLEEMKVDNDDIFDRQIDWKIALRNNMLQDYLMVIQEFQGVCFDRPTAITLMGKIDVWMKEIADDVEPDLPRKMMSVSKRPSFPSKPFNDDGTISATGYNWLSRLDYDVDEEKKTEKAPKFPAKPFKQDGDISASGLSWLEKMGFDGLENGADKLREYKDVVVEVFAIDEKLVEGAKQHLRNQTMPDLTEPMTLANQQDLKEYLVRDEGWRPTLWRTKNATVDSSKQQRSDEEVEEILSAYIDSTRESLYKQFIYHELEINFDKVKDKAKLIKRLKRKARHLPTSPQLKDERGELCVNLEILAGDMAKKVVKWLSYRNRRSVIKALDPKKETGWLNHPRLDRDGKLPSRANGITNTNRRKHAVIANLPKADPKVLLGKEMRSLLGVEEGCWQIGVDASNMENLIAAWWAWVYGRDEGGYYEVVKVGDPHTTNALAYSIAAGREVMRSEGKNITYAVLYGAQANKVAAMLGISVKAAQAVIDAFWDTNYGLKAVKEYLEAFWEGTGKKYIKGIDGRKIWTRSQHSLLNAALQSTGAIMMDLAGIKLHQKLLETGLYQKGCRRTIYYHKQHCGFVG